MATARVDLGEFMGMAIHTVLWRRKVYPRETFRRTVRWGASVWQSMHAGLLAYIAAHVRDAEAWLLKGKLREMQIVINDSADLVPVERFRFRFQASAMAAGAGLTADACRCFFEKILCKDFGPAPTEGRSFSLLLVCHDIDPKAYQASWIREMPSALETPADYVQGVDPILSVPVSSGLELEAIVQVSSRPVETAAPNSPDHRPTNQGPYLSPSESEGESGGQQQHEHHQHIDDQCSDGGALVTQTSGAGPRPSFASSDHDDGNEDDDDGKSIVETNQLAPEKEFDYSPLE